MVKRQVAKHPKDHETLRDDQYHKVGDDGSQDYTYCADTYHQHDRQRNVNHRSHRRRDRLYASAIERSRADRTALS